MTDTKTAPKTMTKNQLKHVISERAGITLGQADLVLKALADVTVLQIQEVGSFTIPDVCKITKHVKPATPEKKMISPFTKEEITVKAKPETNQVKIKPVKHLKDSVL